MARSRGGTLSVVIIMSTKDEARFIEKKTDKEIMENLKILVDFNNY